MFSLILVIYSEICGTFSICYESKKALGCEELNLPGTCDLSPSDELVRALSQQIFSGHLFNKELHQHNLIIRPIDVIILEKITLTPKGTTIRFYVSTCTTHVRTYNTYARMYNTVKTYKFVLLLTCTYSHYPFCRLRPVYKSEKKLVCR